VLAQLKQVKIPAADALGLNDVMAIYQALQPLMPVPQNGGCQLATRLLDILAEFDGLVLDGYGVINIGDGPIDGIAELFDAAASMAKPVLVLTNGASFSSARAFAKYQQWQLPIARDDVLSSRDALMAAFAEPSQTPLSQERVVGVFGRNLEPLVGDQVIFYGCDVDFWQRAEALVFLGAIDWDEADQAAFETAMLTHPRPLYVANPDVIAPQPNDRFSAEPGYWTARMMQQAAKQRISVEVNWYGKPYRPAFDMVMAVMKVRLGGNFDPKRIAMVGDSLHTDILGGSSAGMTTVLITDHGLFRSGSALAYCDACGIRPDWLVNSI